MTEITITKNDHHGAYVWHYRGALVARGENWVCIEAIFTRRDVVTDYVTFRTGDRMVEWFFCDRWYNIFEIHDADDDRIKGWYCNITRPASLTDTHIAADDLALDVFVTPHGAVRVLDEDEFIALALDDHEHQQAHAAVNHIRALVDQRAGPFHTIPPAS